MKIKIVSDGSPEGTHVIDRDTGEELEDVHSIRWAHAAHTGCVAWVEFYEVPAEIETDTEIPRKRVKTG